VLPEYFCDSWACATPTSWRWPSRWAEGPIQRWLADTARELGLWLVGGTLPLTCTDERAAAAQRTAATARLAYSPAGERVARYDKIHLFQFDNGRERYDEAAGASKRARCRCGSTCPRATATAGASA
jgi:predicted amidohydrolase